MRPSDETTALIRRCIEIDAWRRAHAERIETLELLLFGMWMHRPEEVTEALDALRGRPHERGHDEPVVMSAGELHPLHPSDPTPIPLRRNGDPDFFRAPTLKIPLGPHIVTASAEYRIIEPADTFVVEEGLPLISEEELRLVFSAHGRTLNESTLQRMHKAFRDLRADWRQGDEDRVDVFIRELAAKGIGATREAERMAQERGLSLSRRSIGRRLARLHA